MRHLMFEKYDETFDYFAGFIHKQWLFYYSDGDIETIKQTVKI